MTALLIDAGLLPPCDHIPAGRGAVKLGRLADVDTRQDVAWRAFLSDAIAAGYRVGIVGNRMDLAELHARVLAAGVDHDFLLAAPAGIGRHLEADLARRLPHVTTAHVITDDQDATRRLHVGGLELHFWRLGTPTDVAALAPLLIRPAPHPRTEPRTARAAWRTLTSGSPGSRREAQLALLSGADDDAVRCLVPFDLANGRFGLPPSVVTRHELLTDGVVRDGAMAMLRRQLPLLQHPHAWGARVVVPYRSSWGMSYWQTVKNWGGWPPRSGPHTQHALLNFPALVLAAHLHTAASKTRAVVVPVPGGTDSVRPGRASQHLAHLVAEYLRLPCIEALRRDDHAHFTVDADVPEQVLLVDDQITGGGSVQAAARALRRAGATVLGPYAWSGSGLPADSMQPRRSCWQEAAEQAACPAHGNSREVPGRGHLLLPVEPPRDLARTVAHIPVHRAPPQVEYHGGCRHCGRQVRRPVEESAGLCDNCSGVTRTSTLW